MLPVHQSSPVDEEGKKEMGVRGEKGETDRRLATGKGNRSEPNSRRY